MRAFKDLVLPGINRGFIKKIYLIWRIQNPVKHLKWNFLRKMLTTESQRYN